MPMKVNKKLLANTIKGSLAGGALGGFQAAQDVLDDRDRSPKEKLRRVLKSMGEGAGTGAGSVIVVHNTDLLSNKINKKILGTK